MEVLCNRTDRATEVRVHDGKFDYSDLRGTDFSGSDLTNCSFHCSDLNNVRFDGADLTGAKIVMSSLHNASFKKGSLKNTYFGYSDFSSASFESCVLENTHFQTVQDLTEIFRGDHPLKSAITFFQLLRKW